MPINVDDKNPNFEKLADTCTLPNVLIHLRILYVVTCLNIKNGIDCSVVIEYDKMKIQRNYSMF